MRGLDGDAVDAGPGRQSMGPREQLVRRPTRAPRRRSRARPRRRRRARRAGWAASPSERVALRDGAPGTWSRVRHPLHCRSSAPRRHRASGARRRHRRSTPPASACLRAPVAGPPGWRPPPRPSPWGRTARSGPAGPEPHRWRDRRARRRVSRRSVRRRRRRACPRHCDVTIPTGVRHPVPARSTRKEPHVRRPYRPAGRARACRPRFRWSSPPIARRGASADGTALRPPRTVRRAHAPATALRAGTQRRRPHRAWPAMQTGIRPRSHSGHGGRA